jgi:hypothetical protein
VGVPVTPAAPSEQDSLGALISRLGSDIARLLRAEAGLLGMRLVAAVDVMKTLTVGMLVGIVLSMTGFAFTMGAVVLALARWLPPWTAALIVGGVLLTLGVAIAAAAVRTGARDVAAALTTDPIETHTYD